MIQTVMTYSHTETDWQFDSLALCYLSARSASIDQPKSPVVVYGYLAGTMEPYKIIRTYFAGRVVAQ